MVHREDSILMGLRKGSHGAGTGGHLERGETVAECAARELLEETGVAIHPNSFQKLTFTNDIFTVEDKHYVTLYMAAMWSSDASEPRILEPDKCAEWRWHASAPSPLVENLIKGGFDPWGF